MPEFDVSSSEPSRGQPTERSGQSSSRATRVLDEVERLLRLRDKIGAIKVYRKATGVELKDAKDTVDAIEKAMNLEPRGHSMLGAILGKIRGWRGEAG